MTELRVKSMSGAAIDLTEDTLESFRAGMRGEVITPDDEGYDAARRVWNGMVNKRPALIAGCTGAADVIHCVRFAREHDLVVSVRGGGHNYAGMALCNDGLTIDLSPMKGIRVDPARRIAHAQPGLRLGELDRETQAFGLATTAGVNADTGIAGLTLGGGYGWLAGKYGLACDNVLSVDVVTAEGQLLKASPEENDDLFWGVRGAGANLGVVTSFEYRLHEVGPVLGGMIFHPMSSAAETLRFFDEFSSEAPDELSTACFAMHLPDGTPGIAMVACYAGDMAEGERVLAPLKGFGSPIVDLIEKRNYVDMQSLFDEAWPPGWQYYIKSSIVRRLSDEVIETLLDYASSFPTSLSVIGFQQMHGAAARIGATETAFPHRFDHYAMYIHPVSQDPADAERMRQWAKDCWSAMQPHVEQAVYVNALEERDEEVSERVGEAYGSNYERLATIKKKYDPTNLFRVNQNIKPK